MKPTIESIGAAIRNIRSIRDNSTDAAVCTYAALELFRADATGACIAQLNAARQALIGLRRSQVAALENLDMSLATAEATLHLVKQMEGE